MTEPDTQSALRIVVAHNRYRLSGGEDAVAIAEVALLRRKGHCVIDYDRHNDETASLNAGELALGSLWSRQAARDVTRLLSENQADILHVHNTFPLMSPSIYWAADRAGVPVVQTLHNFRLLCPQAMFLREGKVCEDCLGHVPWRGAVHGCYRESRAKSTVLASMLTLHRGLGTWRNKVARYIALNEFCRSKFVEGGLPAKRVVVKPHFVDIEACECCERDGFLFVGRLSAEKGIATLVEASRNMPQTSVLVVGSGPEAKSLERSAPPSINALGALRPEGVRAQMSRTLAVVVPSVSYETFGLVALEAFACGSPVIASRIGALPALVNHGITGLLFEPGNARDLELKMRWALEHRDEMAAMGRNARACYEADYTPDRNYRQLIAVYRDAMSEASLIQRSHPAR